MIKLGLEYFQICFRGMAGEEDYDRLKKMQEGCRFVIDATVKEELEFVTR